MTTTTLTQQNDVQHLLNTIGSALYTAVEAEADGTAAVEALSSVHTAFKEAGNPLLTDDHCDALVACFEGGWLLKRANTLDQQPRNLVVPTTSDRRTDPQGENQMNTTTNPTDKKRLASHYQEAAQFIESSSSEELKRDFRGAISFKAFRDAALAVKDMTQRVERMIAEAWTASTAYWETLTSPGWRQGQSDRHLIGARITSALVLRERPLVITPTINGCRTS